MVTSNLLLAALLTSSLLYAAEPPPAEKWLIDRAVTVSARAVPMPALRLPALPLRDRTPRKATRCRFTCVSPTSAATPARRSFARSPRRGTSCRWSKLPLAEVKDLLKSYQYNLRQLDLGAAAEDGGLELHPGRR